MLAILQQHTGLEAGQHAVLALLRVVRHQRQIHGATAKHRENAGVQLGRFLQAYADHLWSLGILQQGKQALLNSHGLLLELPISQRMTGDVQHCSMREGIEAGLQPFDHGRSGRVQ